MGAAREITAAAALAAIIGGFACAHRAASPDPAPAGGSPPVRRAEKHGEFEAGFRLTLEAAEPTRRFVALIDLTEQLDLRAFARAHAFRTKAARREAVIGALAAVAERQQSHLTEVIDKLRSNGSLGWVRPVAIVNRLVVEGNAAAMLAFAKFPDVAIVRPDWTSEPAAGRQAGRPDSGKSDPEPARSWAIDAMKVESLWRQGIDGRGVVVASIDTGAFEAHEQLKDRRLAGERGWFDPVEHSSIATDRHGHGTAVLSQAVGGNPDGRVVGVAPGAQWAAALGNWKNFYSRSRMTLAADWALRVARPDVLINAWSHDEGECTAFDVPFIDAWKASGIFVVFPAGNGGPARLSGDCPAQLGGTFPGGADVLSVGALTSAGVPDGSSSRGPSRCGGRRFPTLAAPGAELPVAAIGRPDAYARSGGTSLSAGLLGGGAALLLQAAPETDPETLERVLVESCRDVAPPGRDDGSGAGAVDLEAALALLRRRARR